MERENRPKPYPVVVDTNPGRLDRAMIHRHLCEHSHWAKGLPYEVFSRSIEHSLCFGAYLSSSGEQIGFARVISDFATFAYLADVFVLPAHQRKGVCSRMIDTIIRYPNLQGLRRFLLVTTYASEFYAKHGFTKVSHPERMMERLDYRLYQ